jgi:hypothetical protein
MTGEDLQDKPWTLTISHIQKERVHPAPGVVDEKWFLYFQGAQKGLILNKTVADQIAEITGSRDADDWKDFKVTLYPERVKVKGEWKVGVRARKPDNNLDEPPPGMVDEIEDDF